MYQDYSRQRVTACFDLSFTPDTVPDVTLKKKMTQTVLVQLLVLWSLSASLCPFLPQGGSSVLAVADNVMILSHCSYFPR